MVLRLYAPKSHRHMFILERALMAFIEMDKPFFTSDQMDAERMLFDLRSERNKHRKQPKGKHRAQST